MTSDNHVTGPVSDAMIEAALNKKRVKDGEWGDSHVEAAKIGVGLAMKAKEQASVHSPQSSEAVERVARAMCVAAGNDPESLVGRGEDGPLWQAYRRMAEAAISAFCQPETGIFKYEIQIRTTFLPPVPEAFD